VVPPISRRRNRLRPSAYSSGATIAATNTSRKGAKKRNPVRALLLEGRTCFSAGAPSLTTAIERSSSIVHAWLRPQV
jgi:hypothetical protein